MTRALETVIAKLSSLAPADQERIAKWLMAELADEEGWGQRFAQSADELSDMADEALAEFDAGKTTALDPDKM